MGGGLSAYATSAGLGVRPGRFGSTGARLPALGAAVRLSPRPGLGRGGGRRRPRSVAAAAAPGAPEGSTGRECSGAPPGLRGPETGGTGAPGSRYCNQETYSEGTGTGISYHCQLILTEIC